MSITTSVLKGTTNSYETTSEMFNASATDVLSAGVIGAFTNTSGVAPSTGAFAVNAQATPDMTVAVTSGIAYVTATPTSQSSQLLRVNMSANQNVTIAANSTGGTRYDWVYLKVDPTLADAPNASGTDATTLVTSRSTSSTTDNGTPPTYGLVIAVVTVVNGASSIANGSITDSRVNAVVSNSAIKVLPKCRVSASANFNVSHAITQTVGVDTGSWNTEIQDNDSMFDSATDDSRITINTAGTYMVGGNVRFAASTAGGRRLMSVTVKDSSNVSKGSLRFESGNDNSDTQESSLGGSMPVDLAVGDYIIMSLYQDNSASGVITVAAGSGAVELSLPNMFAYCIRVA